MMKLSDEELMRYNRQMMLPGFGEESQVRLKGAKVLVVGAGGLGCPALQYLAAAGVGTIGIVDFDKVEVHNLHRQILYGTDDLGKPKAETVAEKLKANNPNVSCRVFNKIFNKKSAASIVSPFDIVVDGSDNFPTRYLVNDTCVKLNKPLVYGSLFNNEGQLAVFNYKGGKNLRDVFPEPPDPEDAPGCDQNGVLGMFSGILGTCMANACIRIVLGKYEDKGLLLFDFEDFGITRLDIQ